MNTLQRAVANSVSNLPVLGLAKLLRLKFSEQGVEISSRRSELLARQALAGKSEFSIPGERTGSVHVALTEEDSRSVVKWVDHFLENDLEQLLLKLQNDAASRTFASLKRRWPAERRRQKGEINEFRNRLYERWRTGITKLHMLVTLARELGDNINRDARQSPAPSKAALVEALTRLHARSCQVAEEVIVLLESGFANGAIARWRTMHEIAVIAMFISDQGNECAERYIDHQVVESYKGAQEYEVVSVKLGYDPIPAPEMDQIRYQYDHAIKQYGPSFAGQYGWAAKYLPGKQATFREIEKAAKIDYLRGHYRMASHGIHANPKGIFFSVTSMFPTEVLLAGPSNSGLADAGDGAAHSLLTASAMLLSLSPGFDYQVAVRVMGLLREEISAAFQRAHQKLYRDEQMLRVAEAEADKAISELMASGKLTPELLKEAERLR